MVEKDRREENSCTEAKRWRGFLHTHYTPSLKLPPKTGSTYKSPNHLVKALQQKHRISSSARNQPLEMLQNYEDWQAETPTIILDIPGIQAKNHHTDEELRSLTLEALSVAYPSTTWARAYTDGSAEEAAKNGGGGVFIKLPDGRSIRKSVATGQQSTNYRAEAYALLTAAQTLNQEDRLPTNSFFDWLPVHPAESSITRRGPDLQQHQTGAVPAYEQNICDPPVDPFSLWCWRQWRSRPAVKNGKQDGAICTAHVLQRSKDHPKKQLQNGVATAPRHWDRGGQHPPAGQSSSSHNLSTENWTLSTPLPQTENFLLRRMSMRHGSSNPQPHPAILPHFQWLETPDMAQSGEAHRKLWGPVETLRQTADFALLTGLKI